MKVDVIVGGQFGSEAKGLAAYHIAKSNCYDVLIGVNSAQAGHTAPVYSESGEFLQFVTNRQLPSSCLSNWTADIYIGPGAILNLEVLYKEVEMIEALGISIRDRLIISGLASVITPEMLAYARSDDYEKIRAKRDGLDPDDFDKKSFGSTKEGVSQALAARASRTCPIVRDFADEIHEKLPGVEIKYESIAHDLDQESVVLVEGSQGYGLSFYHDFYPKCTARDCSASGFMSMAGIPPRHVRHVYGVFRTFPIRVAGNSGYMFGEMSWEDVTKESGIEWDSSLDPGTVNMMGAEGGPLLVDRAACHAGDIPVYDAALVAGESQGDPRRKFGGVARGNLTEKTTVTQRIRRVGVWDEDLFRDSVVVNGIDRVVLTFMNYLDFRDEGVVRFDQLSKRSQHFINTIEANTGVEVWAASTSKFGGWLSPNPQKQLF